MLTGYALQASSGKQGRLPLARIATPYPVRAAPASPPQVKSEVARAAQPVPPTPSKARALIARVIDKQETFPHTRADLVRSEPKKHQFLGRALP